ncbi:MAG: PIN domain-containing protein [Actinobacteria bacterium]|nr:PIN domain-containing protein [Actinomycetota bacterium]
MRSFVDTNVLLYAVDQSEPEKGRRAAALLEERADDLVLSAQVLSEFYAVATRRLAQPLPEAEAAAYVDDLERLPIVAIDLRVVREGIRLSREARLSYWDGLIIAAAREAGCDVLVTEDLSHGSTIAGVRIENPFVSV